MFEVKVRDNLFIAHSLKEDFFGDAKNLHGATYVIDVIIASNEINKMNVVIDIGLASKILKKCISVYNYKNLVLVLALIRVNLKSDCKSFYIQAQYYNY